MSRRISWVDVGITIFVLAAAILCILPFIHITAISFSSNNAAAAGWVGLWPKQFTTSSYEFVMQRTEFWRAMWVSFQRVAIGGALSLLMCILVAYPLSKESRQFRMRTVYAWIFFLTILFEGGLIPWYMVIKQLGLINSIWALVLPVAVPVFNIVLLLNFFRQLPKELGEAAFVDGAGHWTLLWRIYVPVSAPAIATITLFIIVQHWNSWFDGLILMNHPDKYPMQSYLHTVVINRDISLLSMSDQSAFQHISERTLKSAQILLGALPVLVVYPFLQKYFAKGIIIGSVKG